MLRKYLQDVIQALFKESLAQKTKQTSVKDAKLNVRQTKALIKPETLAIIANNERHDSKSSAESLRLARMFELVLKKFVNPKLDLMTTLEQIKGMEANRREEVLKSLGRMFRFETRSRLPALPLADSSQASDVKTAPEELSIGWSGQPTVNKITSKVETSAPRGIDHAFLKFSDFENVDQFLSAQNKPLAVRLRKTRSRSRKRNHLRKKTSQETRRVTPELSKVYTKDNKDFIDVDVNVRSSNAEQSAPDVRAKDFQDSNDLLSVSDANGQHVQENDLEKEPSEMEKLGKLADAKYKNVRDKSREFCQKLKEGVQDTVSSFVRPKNKNNLYFNHEASGSVDKDSYISERRDVLPSDTRGRQQVKARVELERAIDGSHREDLTEKNEQHDNTFYKINAKEVNLNETDLQVENKYSAAREFNDVSKAVKKSTSKKEIPRNFEIPMDLIKNSPGASSVQNNDESRLQEVDMVKFTNTSPSDSMKVPVKSIFTSIETNDPNSYRKGGKYEKPLSNQNISERDGLSEVNGNRNKELKKKKNPVSYTVKTKTGPKERMNKSVKSEALKFINRGKGRLKEGRSADYKKEKTVDLETKSESSPQEGRKVKTPRRLYSRSSLLKLRNKNVSTYANGLKHKVWTKYPSKKPAVKKERNINKSSSKKVKPQEYLTVVVAKGLNFKAGDYTPRSKHFPKEKFPSVEKLKQKKAKTLASKHLPEFNDINDKNNLDPNKSNFKNDVVLSNGSRRPRTTLTVKEKKRTIVVSNSIPSLSTMLRRKSVSLKESLKTSMNNSINKLSGNTISKKSKTVPTKNENSDKSKKYTTVNEPNMDKKKTASYTLKVGKVRKTLPKKNKEAKITLRMYGIGKAYTFVNNPGPEMQNKSSVKGGKLEDQSKVPTNSFILNKNPVKKTSSAKVSKAKSLPAMKVQRRSFSTTIYYYNRPVHEQRHRSISAKTSRSTPVISSLEPHKEEIVKKLVETNLRTRRSHFSDTPLAEKKISTKQKYQQHRSWITINEGANARRSEQLSLNAVLASSGRGKKVKRTTRNIRLQKKRSNIVPFENKKPVKTSRNSVNSLEKKNLDVQVLFNSSKNKGIDSETNIQLTSHGSMLPNKKLNNKSLTYSTRANNEEIITTQMVQNVVDKCESKARSLKVIVSPSVDIDEDQKRRMWKSREQRLNTLQLYKKPSCVLTLSHQLDRKNDTGNKADEMNKQLGDNKLVSKVYKLNENMDRLISKIKRYKLPNDGQKVISNSKISNTDKNKNISGDGMKIRGKKNKYYWHNGNISEVRDKNHNQSELLLGAQGKMNLAVLRLDELVKSQVSKTLSNAKYIKSSSDKVGKKIKSSAHHGGDKDATLKDRDKSPRIYNDLKIKALGKNNLDLENDVSTILVKLVANAKKAELSSSKSKLQKNYVQNQPLVFNPLRKGNKSLNSVLKYYDSKTSKKNKNADIARPVTNKKLTTNMSNGLLGSKIMHETTKSSINKLATHDKNPSLSKIITNSQICKEFSRITANKYPNNEDSKNIQKAQKLTRDSNKTTQIKIKPTYDLKVSKSYDNQVNINSIEPSKIDTLGKNSYLSKIKSDEYLNKHSVTFKTFKDSSSPMKSKHKTTQQNCLSKPKAAIENLSLECDKNVVLEKSLSHIFTNKANLNKICPKLKIDPSNCSKGITNSTKSMNISDLLAWEKQKNEAQGQIFQNVSNSRTTEEPCTPLVGKKCVVSRLSKYTEDYTFLNKSVPEKLNANLKSVPRENQDLLPYESSDKVVNKFEIPKNGCKPNRLTLSYISKDVMKSDGSSIQFEPIKCNDEGRTADKNKMIDEKPSRVINSLQQKGIKNDSKVLTKVKICKEAEIARLSSSLVESDKLKRQELRNQDCGAQKRHQMEQILSFHTPALKEDTTNKEFHKISGTNEVSESKPKDEKIHNQQIAHQQNYCESAENRETKLTRQKTYVVPGKNPAKVETQENVLSSDKYISLGKSWDGSLSLEPGFI